MKKGLLGLVVIALTVVGCQNYDDQFDDLNKKIASLSSDVTSLSSIAASVTALDAKITSLQGSALTDSDLASILTEIAELEASVEAIDNAAIEAEVADLNTEIDTILDKLGDILSANAYYEGNLTITNLGQLANAQELIKTGADDPTVTVRGNVLVTINSTNGLKDSIAAVNLILSKVRSAQGDVTLTTNAAASLPALSYVTGSVSLNGDKGKVAVSADKLLTVDGGMSISGLGGVVAFPRLSSVGTVTVTTSNVTITTLNLGAITVGGPVVSAANALTLPNATNVHLGGTLAASVTLAKCVDFRHTTGGVLNTDLDLSIAGTAATFSLGSTTFKGTVTITTTGDINLPNITEIATSTFITSKSNAEAHFPALTKITGPVDIDSDAKTVDLTALKTLNSTLNIQGDTTIDLPELVTTAVTTITAGSATSFVAPKLATTSVVIVLKSSGDLTVSILNLADTTTPVNDIAQIANVKTLTVAAQTNNLDVSDATSLATLNFTGKQVTPAGAGLQNNSLTITSANSSLKTLNIGSSSFLGALTVTGTSLVNLTTAGAIVDIDVTNNAALEAFNFGHTHLQGDNESSVTIVNNDDAKLTSIDLSSLSKVGTVVVTGNAKLATLVAPSADVLATSLASITVTINGNDLSGTYTPAVAPTGTVTYSAPVITSAALSSFKAWINANVNVDIASPAGADRTITTSATVLATNSGVTNNVINYNIDLDNVDDTTTSAKETGNLSAIMNGDTNARDGATGAPGDNDNTGDVTGVNSARELATVAD